MDLKRDAFVLTCDPARFDRAAVETVIRELGFKPRFEQQPEGPAVAASRHRPAFAVPPAPPEPIAEALARAREEGLLVLVDFYADWCAPCKVIERRVLPSPEVQKALEGFLLIRVDTDVHPEAARAYEVAAMPTLLLLDGQGAELTRLIGPVTAGELAAELIRVRERE